MKQENLTHDQQTTLSGEGKLWNKPVSWMSRRVLQNNYKYLKANSEKDESNGQRDWGLREKLTC